jgi:hypothetical protein
MRQATLDLPAEVVEKVRLRDESERLAKELAALRKKMARLREDYKALKKQESKKQLELCECCGPDEDWLGPLGKLAYQNSNGTAWRNLPIEQLAEHGLNQRYCQALAKNKISTMGHFAQLANAYAGTLLDQHLEPWLGEYAGNAVEAWESFQKSLHREVRP